MKMIVAKKTKNTIVTIIIECLVVEAMVPKNSLIPNTLHQIESNERAGQPCRCRHFLQTAVTCMSAA